MTKIFKSYYGRKYIIPAEYDIFIDFAPISLKDKEQEPFKTSEFNVRTFWFKDITSAYKSDASIEIVYRLDELAKPEDENEPEPVDTDDENVKQYET
jgi:hypothetical protein